jgi:ferredoxin-type protein NapF
MNTPRIDLARRGFFTGRIGAVAAAVRPPWVILDRFLELCTRCGACVEACPERIIKRGSGGFPELEFQHGECTFCGGCAAACPEPLFDRAAPKPWNATALISDKCLPRRGVICQSCKDACPASAIVVAPAKVPAPVVDLDRCTGCGACVAVCPVDAIAVAALPEAT